MQNTDFIEELESFYEQYKSVLELSSKSHNTIRSYNTTITSFFEFLKQHKRKVSRKTIKQIDILDFLKYKNEHLQKQKEIEVSSKKLYMVHLRTFFTFINENVDDDKFNIKSICNLNIKVPKREPKGISRNDAEKLEDYINSIPHDKFINIRNSIVLKILFYTGARRGELEEIKTSVIKEDGDLYEIQTIGKGNKERFLFIEQHHIKDELEYFKREEILHISATKKGKRTMGGDEIYRLVNTHYRRAGISKKYTGAHILRHTFAKRLRATTDIEDLQIILGHADIRTTSIYTQSSKKRAREAYRRGIKQPAVNED